MRKAGGADVCSSDSFLARERHRTIGSGGKAGTWALRPVDVAVSVCWLTNVVLLPL
jgi:hypothetical protein